MPCAKFHLPLNSHLALGQVHVLTFIDSPAELYQSYVVHSRIQTFYTPVHTHSYVYYFLTIWELCACLITHHIIYCITHQASLENKLNASGDDNDCSTHVACSSKAARQGRGLHHLYFHEQQAGSTNVISISISNNQILENKWSMILLFVLHDARREIIDFTKRLMHNVLTTAFFIH